MKNIFIATATFLCILAGQYASANDPKLVSTSFHTGYVPAGFDDNDRVQIVGEGLFSNSCYRPAPSTWTVQGQNIIVSSKAYFYGGMCLQVLVPYHQVLEIGVLKAGTYKIIDQASGHTLGVIPVAVAKTDEADDYLYAPISQAFYKKEHGKETVTLTGYFTNSCLKMDQIKIGIQSNVIVLQPISKMISTGCTDGHFPFSQKVDLGKVTPGRYLLHIRSLNAQAVNSLVDIE